MKIHLRIIVLLCLFILISVKLTFAQIKVNEIFATNASFDLDAQTYNYVNWVEFYNTSSLSVPLGKLYLTDDSSNLKKWQFPSMQLAAKSFYYAFADEWNNSTHLSFKLNADGGYLIISNTKDSIIDRFFYPHQYYNCSFGRQPDGATALKFFQKPTRNKTNIETGFPGKSKDVVFSKPGGFYSGSVNISLTSPTGTGNIYYTTDGSEPTSASTKYTQPLSITNSTLLRAILVESGRLPGDIITNSYFINKRKSKLPVVSLVTAPKNLWDNTIGIYITGTNGLTGNCSDQPQNWNQDWERSVNFEFYTPDNIQAVNQVVGTKLMGACSRMNGLKSMVISAKSKYGQGKLNYQFFKNKPFNSFNGICLRNAGNDFYYTMFRDALMQTLTIGTMNLEYQAYQPVCLYINGEYYGLINMRERSNDDLLTSNFGLDESNIDLLQFSGVPVLGSGDDYSYLLNYIRTHNLINTQDYKYIESQIDIDNFINYQIFEIYINNTDWPGNNIKFWREKNPKTRWRWIIYDTDFGFGLYGKNADYDMFSLIFDSTATQWPNPEWSTFMLRRLLQNNSFKNKFVTRFYAHINSTFATNRVNSIIDKIRNNIADEMTYHVQRWSSSLDTWNAEVNVLKNFALQRPDYMRGYLKKYFETGNLFNVAYHSDISGRGSISFDGVPCLDTAYSGVFPEGTLCKIEFVPSPGYRFVKALKKKGYSGPVSIIKSGDLWKYNDLGNNLDSAWRKVGYDDSGWLEGKTELGYGDGGESTVINFGDTTNKYITYYFRKKFNFDKSKNISNLKLRFLYDDGGIIYLNGKELQRVNMPAGGISYNTLANGYNGGTENIFFDYPLDSSLLKNGENIIAVEMHQASANSSDLSFDLELGGIENSNSSSLYIYKQSFTDTITEDVSYIGFYETEHEITDIYINEISPKNSVFADEGGHNHDWIEVYNAGNNTIDLAGLYFTDTTDLALSWRVPYGFPYQTTIKPGDHKLFWADDNIFEGPLHMQMKLNKNGEKLILYQKIGNEIITLDEIKFEETPGNRSFGRIPDGTGSFKGLKYVTPGFTNIDNPVEIEITNVQSKEPLNILYNEILKTVYIVPVNYSGKINVIISDISGRTIYSNNLNITGITSIKLDNPKSGILVVKAFSEKSSATKKIMVK